VRDITIRHDLHALSKFFGYAIRQHWTFTNPIRGVEIPSMQTLSGCISLRRGGEGLLLARAEVSKPARRGALDGQSRHATRGSHVLAKADIDLERGQSIFGVGSRKRRKRDLDITSESRSILERRMEGDSSWIFPSEKKARQSHRTNQFRARQRD